MDGVFHIPITLGTLNGIFDKEVKHWEFVVQRYMIKYAQKVASHSGDFHQAAGTLRAHGDTEQTATQKAGPSGLLVQCAMVDKPVEEDSTVQHLRTAEIKQFVAAKKKRNKVRAFFYLVKLKLCFGTVIVLNYVFVWLDGDFRFFDSVVGLY